MKTRVLTLSLTCSFSTRPVSFSSALSGQKISSAPRYSAFVDWGIHGIAGLSYAYDDENNLSIGVGQVVNRVNENRYKGLRFLTPSLDGVIGIFYDKNN